jgi:hypothetical protein
MMTTSLQELRMSSQHTLTARHDYIDHSSSAPPVTIPPGHVGEFVIPGTGKRVWWTGRVAIGLLHQPEQYFESTAQSSLWIQKLMLTKTRSPSAVGA